jgi:segregation and condensation protein B
MNTLQQKIESLLFFKNEPVSFSWLAKQLSITAYQAKEIVEGMLPHYQDRGITLVYSTESVSLLTSDVSEELISSLSKRDDERELSKQALETLSIILYKSNITKSELDYIRGVNSVFILRNLLIRGLIEKIVNPQDKRASLYTATHDTYSFLGIHHGGELPDFDVFTKKLKKLELEWIDENKVSSTLSETSDLE